MTVTTAAQLWNMGGRRQGETPLTRRTLGGLVVAIARCPMQRRHRLFAVAAVLAALSMIATPSVAAGKGPPVGAVYVASSAYSANSILTFPRFADGSLGL